jgi:hypothetical protein
MEEIPNDNLTITTNTTTTTRYYEQLLERDMLTNILLENQAMDTYDEESLINTENINKYKYVLSEKGRKSLRTIQYRKGVCKNDNCPIIQEKFKTRKKVTILPCLHGFNPESIEKWLDNQNVECPLCRFKLDKKQVINEEYTENQNIHDSRITFLNSLSMMDSIVNPFGRNTVHPFGVNQLQNTIPHSYINSNGIIDTNIIIDISDTS